MPGFDFGNGPAERVELAVAGRAARDHGAIGLGLTLGRDAGAVENLLGRDQVVAGNLRLRYARLRAVAAVLAAQPTLGVDQEVQVDPIAEPPPPHAIGGRQEVEQFVVLATEDGQTFVGRQSMAVEHPLGQVVPAANGRMQNECCRLVSTAHAGFDAGS